MLLCFPNPRNRSKADLAMINVMHNNQLAMYQTHAEVTSLSHSTGGDAGGLPVTISGNFFDDTTDDPRVTVGGVECDDVMLSQDATEITCTVPEEPTTVSMTGNRGTTLRLWNSTTLVADDDATLQVRHLRYRFNN